MSLVILNKDRLACAWLLVCLNVKSKPGQVNIEFRQWTSGLVSVTLVPSTHPRVACWKFTAYVLHNTTYSTLYERIRQKGISGIFT